MYFINCLTVALALLCLSLDSAAFSVGPYALGTKSAEAAKTGLQNCRKFTEKLAVCDGTTSTYPELEATEHKSENEAIEFMPPTITIDLATKRIVKITQKIYNIRGEGDSRLSRVFDSLRFEPCVGEVVQVLPSQTSSLHGCYKAPNMSREWSFRHASPPPYYGRHQRWKGESYPQWRYYWFEISASIDGKYKEARKSLDRQTATDSNSRHSVERDRRILQDLQDGK